VIWGVPEGWAMCSKCCPCAVVTFDLQKAATAHWLQVEWSGVGRDNQEKSLKHVLGFLLFPFPSLLI